MADDRFYVKSLTLENFRCFEKTELGPFDQHFNLLIGENGSGKSSVLLALAFLFRSLGSRGFYVRSDEILDARDNRKVTSDSQKHDFPWKLISQFAISGVEDETSAEYSDGDITDEFPIRQNMSHLIVLYDVRRRFKRGYVEHDYEPDVRDESRPAFESWLDAGADVSALREWIKDRTLLTLQTEKRRGIARTEVGSPIGVRELKIVETAVVAAVDGATKVEFDAEFSDIVVYFENLPPRAFSTMSDGQRALVGLVADLARRAVLLNPPRPGANTLEETTGLVLIDEIDLHLHPKWQRQIVGALKRIFPKIQFFATTHSPQVIGEAQPHEIVLLTADGKQKRPSQSFGMDSNWVLECVMEAEGRDPDVAKEIKRLYDDIEDGNFDSARARIGKLRDEIGGFGEVEAAENYMWRVEHAGDEAAE